MLGSAVLLEGDDVERALYGSLNGGVHKWGLSNGGYQNGVANFQK